jgi:acetyltransferase-like isoleucine patch superfamily enzyme
MKRDFSYENHLNILARTKRALIGRLRGYLFRYLGFFSKGSGSGLFFGSRPRFINPGAMLLGDGVCFGTNARLECFVSSTMPERTPKLIISGGTTFGDGVHIGCINRIEIGRNVLFGSYVLIVDHSHGHPREDLIEPNLVSPHHRPIISKAGVKIEDKVWIGDGAVILAGAHIGEGAVIGANAVVRGKILSRTTFIGEQR